MRPPVVTVSCPSCGGKVTDAELGDRTRCKYCGTELHLPALASPPTKGPEPEPEFDPEFDPGISFASEPKNPAAHPVVVVAAFLALAVVVGYVWISVITPQLR